MKVLDVAPFREGLQRNIVMLERLEREMVEIEKSVAGLVAQEESLKGEGGQAIRTFYDQCHLPFLRFFKLFKARFTNTLEQMTRALDTLESDLAGFIRESFLEIEVEEGLNHVAQITGDLTEEANQIMNQVADIIALPHLDDIAVQESIRRAKMYRNETVTQLNEFDAAQTTALMAIEDDLGTMTTWIASIEGMFTNGVKDVNFPLDEWAALLAKNTLKTDLASDTASLSEVPGMMGIDGEPTTSLATLLIGGNSTNFSYGFVNQWEKTFRVGGYSLPGMRSCAIPMAGVDEKVGNPILKSWNSFGEIGTGFLASSNERWDKVIDSPYDFANYLTGGISGGFLTGLKDRNDKALDSTYDFANHMTFGLADMSKGALAPEDPLSKEHWLDSFGLATSVIGGVKAVGSKKSAGTISDKGKSKPKEIPKVSKGNSNQGKATSQGTRTDVTYYRVQGGVPPKASMERISKKEDGGISIQKEVNVNISTGDIEHAKYFLKEKRSGGEIVAFDLPDWFDEFVKETAIPQRGYKKSQFNQDGTAPKIVDPTTPGHSYEFPPIWSEWFEEYGKNGKIIRDVDK